MLLRDRHAAALLDTIHGDWRGQAACKDHDPELFFPNPLDHTTAKAAKQVCRGCPVAKQCLYAAYLLGADDGIWGGLDENERRAQRPGRPTTRLRSGGGPRGNTGDRAAIVRRLVAAGNTDLAIAQQLGIHARSVSRIRSAHDIPPARPEFGRGWSADELAELQRLAAIGARDGEIAAVLGRTTAAVYQRRHFDGIPTLHQRGSNRGRRADNILTDRQEVTP